MTEKFQAIVEGLHNSVNMLAEIASNSTEESEAAKQKHYQDVVLQQIDVKSKSISADKVMAWSGVGSEYFLHNKPRIRNAKRTKTYWGIDVIKWLCDLWQRDYPENYINECYVQNINTKTGDFMAA